MLNDLWAIEPLTGASLADPKSAVGNPFRTSGPGRKSGDVLIVNAVGVLTRNLDRRLTEIGNTTYGDIAALVDIAADDDKTAAIVLRVNSPGGTVDGSEEAAEAVYRASQRKPTVAVVEGMAASGAYLLASQTSGIYTGRMDQIGSLGTYLRLEDSSGRAAQEGRTVHVIRSGEHKGTGIPGAAISAEQLKAVQLVIDRLAVEFNVMVARGRKMPATQIQQIADGRIYVGTDAVAAGLTDGIATLAETIQRLQAGDTAVTAKASRSGRGGSASSEFLAAVEAAQATGLSRSRATSKVVSEQPQLHAAMLTEVNHGRASA